jgi:hypothetical protein
MSSWSGRRRCGVGIGGAALLPFGKEIVSVADLRSVPEGAVVIGSNRAAT